MVYILALVVLLGALLYVTDFFLFAKFNQTPLNIHTFDGSCQPYHPSVLFFEEGWNGYRYWMVETPYPIGAKPYRDRWECPEIHVSNDGRNWEELTNRPIDNLTEEEVTSRDFFSDPHLVFVNGHLECFYRFSHRLDNGFHTVLYRRKSNDGISWSDRELVDDFFSEKALSTVGDMVRSPAIISRNGLYHMWYVDSLDPKATKKVCYSSSSDGITWEKKIYCQLKGADVEPWHLDVAEIGGIYYLTIYDFHNLTLWKSDDMMNFLFFRTILTPSYKYGSFYSDGLYRSSLIKDNESFKIYFSAFSERRTSIGLLSGVSLDDMKIESIEGHYVKFRNYPIVFIKNWRRRLYPIKAYLQAKMS